MKLTKINPFPIKFKMSFIPAYMYQFNPKLDEQVEETFYYGELKQYLVALDGDKLKFSDDLSNLTDKEKEFAEIISDVLTHFDKFDKTTVIPGLSNELIVEKVLSVSNLFQLLKLKLDDNIAQFNKHLKQYSDIV